MRKWIALVLLVTACGKSSPHPVINDAPHVPDAAVDASPDAPPSCIDPATGCFKSDVCQPQQLDDFLNACTTVPCQEFDNTARLPLYNDGNLPPLPS